MAELCPQTGAQGKVAGLNLCAEPISVKLRPRRRRVHFVVTAGAADNFTADLGRVIGKLPFRHSSLNASQGSCRDEPFLFRARSIPVRALHLNEPDRVRTLTPQDEIGATPHFPALPWRPNESSPSTRCVAVRTVESGTAA